MPHRLEYWKNGRNRWKSSLEVETGQGGILDLAKRRPEKWMNRMVGVNAGRITKKIRRRSRKKRSRGTHRENG